MGAHFLQACGYSSMMLFPVFLTWLGADRAQVGAAMAIAAVGGLAARPGVAWCLDRVGRKPTLIAGTVLLAGSVGLIGTIDAFGPWVYVIRVLIGVGTATLFTGYFTLAADLVPKGRRTEGLALFGISGLVPLAVNPFADQIGIHGGELRFFFVGIGALIGLSLLFLVPVQAPASISETERSSLRDVLNALRKRELWPVWLATLLFSGLASLFMVFATVTAASRGVEQPANLWLTYALGAVSVRALGARLPERLGPSRVLGPALSSYVIGVIIVAVNHAPGGFLVAGALCGVGHGYCFPILASQTVTRTPETLRGTAMSLFTALWDLSKLALVPVFGVIAREYGDQTMFLMAAALAVVGVGIWAILERH
jgi:MFS family permease